MNSLHITQIERHIILFSGVEAQRRTPGGRSTEELGGSKLEGMIGGHRGRGVGQRARWSSSGGQLRQSDLAGGGGAGASGAASRGRHATAAAQVDEALGLGGVAVVEGSVCEGENLVTDRQGRQAQPLWRSDGGAAMENRGSQSRRWRSD